MRYVIYSNIEWDTDGEPIKLPNKVHRLINFGVSDEDVKEDSSEYLSSEYGYCVLSFTYEFIDITK